ARAACSSALFEQPTSSTLLNITVATPAEIALSCIPSPPSRPKLGFWNPGKIAALFAQKTHPPQQTGGQSRAGKLVVVLHIFSTEITPVPSARKSRLSEARSHGSTIRLPTDGISVDYEATTCRRHERPVPAWKSFGGAIPSDQGAVHARPSIGAQKSPHRTGERKRAATHTA